MKVFSCPGELEFNQDFSNFDLKREEARIAKHKADLTTWLQQAGYTGKNTGQVIGFGVADGSAQYMVGDNGRSYILIHLPYWDAYQFPYVNRLTKADINAKIKADKAMAAFFAKR